MNRQIFLQTDPAVHRLHFISTADRSIFERSTHIKKERGTNTMKRRDIALAAALLPFASIFAGSTAFAADAGNLKKLRVGVTAGPAAEILEQVVPLAKAKGLDIQIFEFQDYIQPNAALDSGDLDANIFQTIPFMEQTIKDRGYHLNVAGKGFTLPMAFYSKKVKSFAEAPKGATVGIPNDPAMGGRALFLLEKGGVIKLRKGVGYTPSVLDIVENPKDLKFVELEAAQLPHSLNDLTISAVNGNYAYVANLNPTRDGILVEDADGPYVCNIVVNTKDLGKPWVKQLVEAYQQPQIAAWIKEKYKGIVIPGF